MHPSQSSLERKPLPDSSQCPSPDVPKQLVPQRQTSFSGASPGTFYTGSPYAQFSTAEASEMMAAAHMQPRQYQMYTPQSNSPVSTVSSSHGQEQPRLYSQASQMQPTMYYPTYAMGHLPTQASHQMMTPPQSAPAVPQHQAQQSMHAHTTMHAPPVTNSPRPQIKYETNLSRSLDSNNIKPPPSQMTSSHSTPKSASQNGSVAASSQASSATNPAAAPGPIPATTPLVVRQDRNGVQWIAFEYSRDRVKLEYQIRCDVESVNTDELDKEFKEENCVYPRAFCDKGNYSGNRLNYETECNTVGWSLVKLNPELRGKRGLIQRAVDSWRNSNQDSRLRSRRVRRMNKQSTRSKNPPNSQRDSTTPSNAMLQQRPLPQAPSSTMPSQIHHHRTNLDDNGLQRNVDNVNVNGHFDSQFSQKRTHPAQSPSQMRPANVFQGYPSAYPLQPHGSVSLAPSLHNGLEPQLSSHPATTISASHPTASSKISAAPKQRERISSSPSPKNLSSMYPVPTMKRYLITTDDANSTNRVRVKLDLRNIQIDEVPDDFRDRNSVFPRSYYPNQMKLSAEERRQKRLANRFVDVNAMDGDGFENGRTMVKVPTLEGDIEAPVPRLGRCAGQQEEVLNDTGYRISWNQVRKYDKRVLFLQRTVDLWRKKMRDESNDQETRAIVPHQNLRAGKRDWACRPRLGQSTSL